MQLFFKYIGLISFFILFCSCAAKKDRNITDSNTAKTITYLSLGDSYTIGESVDNRERWPLQLETEMASNDITLETLIIAQTGWRTDNLLDAAANELTNEKFDLVSLLIGVNNEYQGESADGFEAKFRTCLNMAIAHSKKGKQGVFIVSIPDYGYTPYGKPNQEKISKRLTAYNSICRSVAEAESILFVDITPISKTGLKDPSLVASDGLHPSGKQYGLWVQLMLKSVSNLIH